MIDYLRSIIADPELSHLKLLGICFGHQILDHALGGTSEKGKYGMEVGLYDVQLSHEGRAWFGVPPFEADAGSAEGKDAVQVSSQYG